MISIIVPCYKVTDFLPQCIESLMNQTYKDIEIMELSDLKNTKRGQKIVVDEALLLLKDWLECAFSVKVDTVSYTKNM